MNELTNRACLAQGKETCASSSLGFRDERLLKLEQILEQYNELDFKEPDDIRMSGQLVMGLVEEINKKLIRLLESKRRPMLSRGIVTKFKTMANPNHWLESKLFQVLPRKECKQLRECIEEMVDLIKAVWLKVINVDPDFADQLFERLKKRCRRRRITDYDVWKVDQPELTMALLTHYQAQLTADMLKSGILEYDYKPRGEEMDGVDLPRLMKKLNCDTLPEKFDEECAKLRRYSHWEGELFIIDYHRLRKYIYRVFKLLSNDQRIALFNYDIQMKQIHKDMKEILKRQQEAQKYSVLKSEKAMPYWKKLIKLGLVDSNCQLLPGTSRQQAMYIVEPFAEKLGLKNKWKEFEDLWGIKNLAQEKWRFQQTAVLPPIHDEIDGVFEDDVTA